MYSEAKPHGCDVHSLVLMINPTNPSNECASFISLYRGCVQNRRNRCLFVFAAAHLVGAGLEYHGYGMIGPIAAEVLRSTETALFCLMRYVVMLWLHQVLRMSF